MAASTSPPQPPPNTLPHFHNGDLHGEREGTSSVSTPERIPIWRNIKTIGTIAQVVFVAVIVGGAAILVNNVVTALAKANLPADFSWLSQQAGIPIAEKPIPYDISDPYWRALIIAFLNTLKVALIGVVLASFIGVLVGVMRLSANWLIRTIATIYIELLRNIPLAVQIVFWYSAVLLPFPPRISNPVVLPGGILLSNIGIAAPFPYPTYAFMSWLPWLAGATLLAILAYAFRKRQVERQDRIAPIWPFPIVAFLVIAGAGYAIVTMGSVVPENLTVRYDTDRGRGVVEYIHDNGDASVGAFAGVTLRIDEAQLTTTTQNLEERKVTVRSTFRFPLIHAHEFDTATVTFGDAERAEAAGYAIHFERFPSVGTVYVDQNGNGEYDAGEEINPVTGSGYNGLELVLQLEAFERFLVSNREGIIRTPLFKPFSAVETAAEASSGPAPGSGRFSVFGAPAAAAAEEAEPAALVATTELVAVGPFVVSPPTIPVTNYEGGLRFTVNYLALLFALVIYTSAFIAEIVRGGIQAVAKGQREAAEALGLSASQSFRLIIFPQALRVILPPMISQYLNLTKNSSLSTLAGYAELFVISSIMANQTGASVPIALMLVASYLFISLVFAFVLNKVNDRLALVGR